MDPRTTVSPYFPRPRRRRSRCGGPGRLRQFRSELGTSGYRGSRRRRGRRTLLVPHRRSRRRTSARRPSTASTRPTPTPRSPGRLFQNDAYKTKIKTALGAGQAPTIIWGWGGGGLKSWVDASQVEDLTAWFSENAAVKDRSSPRRSAPPRRRQDLRDAGRDGPADRPVLQQAVFDKVGVQPPQTWGDIMALVPKFNAAGIAPFSLGGQSRWTNMMWLEFLFDRIGGPEVFQAVFDGKKDAWSNPWRDPGPDRDAGPHQGQRLHQGLLLDHRRLQRRPGAAVHRQGRDDAARRVDLRQHEDRRRRLRHRRPPRLHELPDRRRRQGRPERHGRQPRSVPVDLLQGDGRREGRRRRSSSRPRVLDDDRARRGSTPAPSRS